MKRVLLLSFCIVIISNIYAQNNAVKTLIKSYKLGFVTKGKDSVYYQKIFFNTFPSDFKSFNAIYGWNNKEDKPNPLSDTYDHINHFFALKCINTDTLTEKIIKISINGIWDADDVGMFQHNLQDLVISRNKEFIKLLQTHSDKDIISVWRFYFDYENSFARKDNFNKLIKLVPVSNKKMIAFITAGYQKSTKYWKDNH
jgi:hypothetical protein